MATTEELFSAYQKGKSDLTARQASFDQAKGRFDQAKLELDQATGELKASKDSLKGIETAFAASLSTHAGTL